MFSYANAGHGGNLVPLMKMIKAWNKTHGSLFTSSSRVGGLASMYPASGWSS